MKNNGQREIGLFRWIREKSRVCVYDLAHNDLPFPDPAKIGIDHYDPGASSDTERIRKEFVRGLSGIFGINEKYIHPVASGSTAIYLSALLISTKEKTVFIPAPEYEPLYLAASLAGMKFREISLGEKPAGSVMLSLPNNPLGVRPDHYVDALMDTDHLSFVDETFILFNRSKKSAFRAGKNLITSGTTTKYFGLGSVKVGWIVCDDDYAEELENIIDTVVPGVPAYSMLVATMAMKHMDYFQSRADRIMEVNLKLVDDFVMEHRTLSWTKPDSAPVGFIHFGSNGSVELCTEILQKTGVLLVPGKFMHDDTGFRISFITETEKLGEALDRLHTFF